MACSVVAGAALLFAAHPLSAQEATPPQDPFGAEAASRPGRFKLGPFYLTPSFVVGTLGLDTNVFYTASERRTDATANGGPGVEVVLPLGRSVRLLTDLGVNYLYFVRTESQRRLAGHARSGLEYATPRLTAEVQEAYTRSYERPSFEVDRRILQDRWGTSGELSVKTVARLRVHTGVSHQRIDVGSGQRFLGTDPRTTLSRNESKAWLGLQYGLTPKTFLILEGDHQIDRFRFDERRDAHSNRLYGGFRVDSKTRLFGRAVLGERFFRLQQAPVGRAQAVYAAVELWYRVGPKTLVGGSFNRDLDYSAFDTSGATPTITQQTYGARIEKGLVGRLDLRLSGRVTRFRTDGAIAVETSDGSQTVAVRADRARELGADLGYKFPSSLRVGVAAVYTNRRSNFKDFGIHGLLVGASVSYDPDKRRR
jgi:hypothetical protein